jgi:secondary thiamine-phosphate synthase enzyme
VFKQINLKTHQQTELIDLTAEINQVLREIRVEEGICYLFVPHTTAGITINENADPSVVADLLKEINKIVPFSDHYTHLEGNSAAHIKASLIGPSEMVFIENGRLCLGTWQGIYFCEFDGPRQRKLWLKITREKNT